ncbi:MAG: hypothetical protein HYZ73_05880 [Elusimicrobia bacterium]|nr:hypothetical protein [Elusimicrobiota bacterium]
MRRFVSELLSYVNTDLFERNAAKFLPPFSRRALFKKPKNWGEVFWAKHHEVPNLQEDLDLAIAAAQEWLLSCQHAREGYWCAPLLADPQRDFRDRQSVLGVEISGVCAGGGAAPTRPGVH